MADGEIEAMVDAGTALLGIPLRPDWRGGVAFHLRTILAQAAALETPPLPDEADPAAVYRV